MKKKEKKWAKKMEKFESEKYELEKSLKNAKLEILESRKFEKINVDMKKRIMNIQRAKEEVEKEREKVEDKLELMKEKCKNLLQDKKKADNILEKETDEVKIQLLAQHKRDTMQLENYRQYVSILEKGRKMFMARKESLDNE